MIITYVLLSPTFGMHQYTAYLAGRMTNGNWRTADGQPTVRLVTTTTLPRDRYDPAVEILTPVTTRGTGFSREGLDIAAYRRVRAMCDVQSEMCNVQSTEGEEHSTSHISHSTFDIPHSTSHIPHSTSPLVHFTGVHLWNVPLVRALRRRGVPVIHSLHDLDPHTGVRFAALIRLWNRLIIATGCHLLVHGRRYREELLARGVPAGRVTCVPLLHGFLAADRPWPPAWTGEQGSVGAGERGSAGTDGSAGSGLNGECKLTVLFFGRVEAYKGVDLLLAAWPQVAAELPAGRLVIAGACAPGIALPPLPPKVELRDRRIDDAEGEALFRSADVLVLPYRDATQTALIAAAYAFGVPVIVTDAGALPEYVIPGQTGWVAPAGDAPALADALLAALRSPEALRRMGAAGRAWFEAQRREEEMTLAEMYAPSALR